MYFKHHFYFRVELHDSITGASRTLLQFMLSNYVLSLLYFIFYDFARGYDFTVQENGLQIDQPPEIGNISTVRIIIMKNDNAEGIIEFDPRYTTFEGRFSNLT